jgi:hypothetical protein
MLRSLAEGNDHRQKVELQLGSSVSTASRNATAGDDFTARNVVGA